MDSPRSLARIVTEAEISVLIPARPPRAHKYSFGRLQIVAGSGSYPGAAILCALGAFKAGCGYVTLRTSALPATVLASLPELILGEDTKATALAIGPGLVVEERGSWEKFLRDPRPKIIDATALFLVKAENMFRIENAVFTPHGGEAAKIFSLESGNVESDRMEFLGDKVLPRLHPSSCFVLKGERTLIAHQGRILENPTGNVSQANAGQGDLLSGVMGALLAHRLSVEDAAKLACFTLGRCAEKLSSEKYLAGVLAHEIAREISPYWGSLLESSEVPALK